MKAFTDLNLGFTNAENYRHRENKDLFSRYFVRDEYLEKILKHNVYFIIGEKGTGKTAYSTYLSNNKYKNKNAFSFDVRQTEYQKLLELKRLGHLPLSQHSELWRVVFLILSAASILKRDSTPAFLQKFTKMQQLKNAIDAFYNNAFSPEIIKVINFVESSEISSSLSDKIGSNEAKIGANGKFEIKDSKTIFQTNILGIRRDFESALEALKLTEDYIIFIDGIDVRPSDITYGEYFECVRGIIEATWAINSDFLSNIKDSKGRIKIVLLVRPDIFLNAGLHNVNTKIRDNSVLLNWKTTYKDHRSSSLFEVADRILAVQNDATLSVGTAWDNYFRFEANNLKYIDGKKETGTSSFLSFLRFSFYRPRDINAMMGTMQDVLSRKGPADHVTRVDFDDPTFRDAHADYLLGEIRDQLLFYYTSNDYELFLRFFSYLNGKKKFSYDEYELAFRSFISETSASQESLPKFFESSEVFLQFLYDQNIICYIEKGHKSDSDDDPFIRWCFRERTPSNLSPKVRTHVDYEIFYGLTKALNVGRPIRTNAPSDRREVGTIISLRSEGKFGFIRGGNRQDEYYFPFRELADGYAPRIGDKVTYDPYVKYGKLRARSINRS